MVLLVALCIAVTLLLVVLLVAARHAMRTEFRGWIQSRVDDDAVIWHEPGWDEETREAAAEAVRRARAHEGAEH